MWARIEAGIVAEITDTDPAGRFAPDLIWVPCASSVKPGDVYDGSVFGSAPTPPPVIRYVPVSLARERLEAAGHWEDLVTWLATDMPRLIKLLTLAEGLDPGDAEVRAVLAGIGANPDEILA